MTRQDCINCKYCKQQTEYCGYCNTYNLLICDNERSVCFGEIINPFDRSECKYFEEKEIEPVNESIRVINLINEVKDDIKFLAEDPGAYGLTRDQNYWLEQAVKSLDEAKQIILEKL